MPFKAEYEKWLYNTEKEQEIQHELVNMTEAEKEDAFRCDLEFGTAGLRGIMGAGTNRMNQYIVGKASQGVANYLHKHYQEPVLSLALIAESIVKPLPKKQPESLLPTESKCSFGLC